MEWRCKASLQILVRWKMLDMNIYVTQYGFAEAFDYCQFMILALNSKQWIAKKYTFPGKESEDIERIERIISIDQQVDNRLKLFFDCECKGVSFLSQYFYEVKNKSQIRTIEDLRNAVENDESFKDKLVRFYLGEAYSDDTEVMHALMTDYKELDSSYKEMLMYYLVFEQEYRDVLFSSMVYVKEKLKNLYQKEIFRLRELEKEFDFCSILEQKRILKKWVKDLQQVEISFSYCNQYVIVSGENAGEVGWMIFGWDYPESLGYKWSADVPIEKIGNALGDEMRIRIIREVQAHGEMSAPQLAKIMNLPSSAIFYHLDILRKAVVLCSRLKGRTAYYWINQNAFEKMIMQLKELGGLSHG